MKKIMIGILVIIPLIVMLTVGLIGRYVSQKVHIGVESISFDTDNLSINLSDYTAEEDGSYIIDLKALLNPVVLPSHANARDSVEWSMADLYPSAEETGGAVASLVNETDGKVRVTTYCSFYIYASAEQQTAKCYVEITDKEVQSITLTGADTVSVGASVLLSAQYAPLNSIVTSGEWTVADPSVATVDANGVVKGVSVGETTVSFTTMTEEGTKAVTGTKKITVTAGVTVYGDKFSVHTPTLDLAAIGFDYEGATATGGTVSGNEFTFGSGVTSATVTSADGKSFTVEKCAEDEIAIAHSDIFTFVESSDEPYVVATDEVPLTLTVEWKSALKNDEISGAVWSIDDKYADIATVSEDGVVTPVGTGLFVVKVSVGGEEAEITLACVKKIAMVRLADTESSLQVGLALETVFATGRYDTADANIVANWFDVSILQPADVDYAALDFSVAEADADKAAFSDPEHPNRLVFNPEGVTERTTVTFTVRALYPKYAGLASSTVCTLTLNVVPGVAVYDVADWNKATADNASTDAAVYEKVPSIVLMSDLMLETSDIEKDIWCDIYGNNYALKSTSAIMTGDGTTIISLRGSDITVSNVVITNNSDIKDEMTDDEKAKNRIKGRAINIEYKNRQTGVQNCSEGVRVYGAQVDLVGVIVRNIGYNGIFTHTGQEEPDAIRYATIGIHNCVFSNLLLMPLAANYDNYGTAKDNETLKAERLAVVRQEIKKPREEQRNTTVTQTGFWDVYNWKDLDNSFNLLTGLAGDLGTFEGYEAAFEVLNQYVMSQLLSPKFEPIIARTDLAKYVHFGVFSLGAVSHSYLDIQFEEGGRWKEITTNDMPDIEMIAGLMDSFNLGMDLIADPIRIWSYYNTESSVPYNAELVVNNRLIQRLHS